MKGESKGTNKKIDKLIVKNGRKHGTSSKDIKPNCIKT